MACRPRAQVPPEAVSLRSLRTGKTGRSSTRAQPVGRIYEDTSASTPAELRWFWSITVYVPPSLGVRTNDKVASLAEAKRCFLKAWETVQSNDASSALARELFTLFETGYFAARRFLQA